MKNVNLTAMICIYYIYYLILPLLSFRNVRTLWSHLVRAKIYPLGERLVGSSKYNKNRCQVSKNVIETETFQSFFDKKVCKIDHRFTCSDKCQAYLLSCKVCGICMVKLTMNSDTSGIIIRITIGKV